MVRFGDEPGWLRRLLGPINDPHGISGIFINIVLDGVQGVVYRQPSFYFINSAILYVKYADYLNLFLSNW